MLSKIIIDKLRTSSISLLMLSFFYNHYLIFIFERTFLKFSKFINFLVQVFFSYIDYIQKDIKFCKFNDNWLILTKFQKLTFPFDCHTHRNSWLQFFQSSDPHKTSPHPFPSGTEEDRQASLSSLYMAGNPHASSVWPRFGPGRFRSNAFGYSRVYRVRSSVLTFFFFCNGVNNGWSDGPAWHLFKCLGSEV